MPHVIMEYSANLKSEVEQSDILKHLHKVMIDCGLFGVNDIKSRAYCAEDFLVGDENPNNNFIHIIIALLDGRPSEKRKELAENIGKKVAEYVKGVKQLTVDVQEMQRDTFFKIAR